MRFNPKLLIIGALMALPLNALAHDPRPPHVAPHHEKIRPLKPPEPPRPPHPIPDGPRHHIRYLPPPPPPPPPYHFRDPYYRDWDDRHLSPPDRRVVLPRESHLPPPPPPKYRRYGTNGTLLPR